MIEDGLDIAIEFYADGGSRWEAELGDLCPKGKDREPAKQDQLWTQAAAKQTIEFVPCVIQ